MTHPAGMLLAPAALAVAGTAAWVAASVRRCPADGDDCAWFPWLGVPAAVVALLAVAAAAQFFRWAISGRGREGAVTLLGSAAVIAAMWVVAFFVALGGSSG